MGVLYWAPVGATPESSWTRLGEIGEALDDLGGAFGDLGGASIGLSDALLDFHLSSRSVTMAFSANSLSPYAYWLLFRRRHPRVKAMHAAYRRKTRHRNRAAS